MPDCAAKRGSTQCKYEYGEYGGALREGIAADVVMTQSGRVEEAGPAVSVLGNPQSAYTRTLLVAASRMMTLAVVLVVA